MDNDAMTYKPMPQDTQTSEAVFSRISSYLLRLPLFSKILIANSGIILFWGVIGLWILFHYFRSLPWGMPAAILVFGALILSIVVNFILVRLALTPLEDLSNVMINVGRGNLNLRAQYHPLGGKFVDQCANSLNNMLDILNSTMKNLEWERERSRKQAMKVLSAQEEERKRIARELHDETSQVLASLVIGLEQLQKRMPGSIPDCLGCKQEANRLKSVTEKSLDELHRLVFNLRPSLLDDMGLKSALSWLLREQVEKKGLKLEVNMEGSDALIPDEIEIVLFRVAQEGITNIMKYANAALVTFNLIITENNAELEILDDGIGFDPAAVARDKEKRLGLFGMQERVELFYGTFKLESLPGRGTSIQVSIPFYAPSVEIKTEPIVSPQGVAKQ